MRNRTTGEFIMNPMLGLTKAPEIATEAPKVMPSVPPYLAERG
jgi:hypothetical protein